MCMLRACYPSAVTFHATANLSHFLCRLRLQMDCFPIGLVVCRLLGVATPWDHLMPEASANPANWTSDPLEKFMLALYDSIPSGDAAAVCAVTSWASAAHLPVAVQELLQECLQPNAWQRRTPLQLLHHAALGSLPKDLPIGSRLRQVCPATAQATAMQLPCNCAHILYLTAMQLVVE